MNGNQELDRKTLNRINNLINGEPEVVRGFSYFLNNSSLVTRYTYLTYVVNFIHAINKDAKELTFNDFLFYMDKIKFKEDGSQTTQSYQISVYSALKKFSEYLFASKIIDDHYMQHVHRPKAYDSQKTIEKRNKGYLNVDEIKNVLDAVECNDVNTYRQAGKRTNLRDKLIIKTLLTTGMRCTALVKLDKSGVDFSKNLIITTDKNNKVKEYEMPQSYMDDLKVWVTMRDDVANENTDALFVTKFGKRMTQESVSKVTLKYSKRIKGKHITPHKLRATYGTQLYNQTGDIYFVQECMGHNSPKTTELYIRGNKNRTKEAASIIDSIIK